MMETTKKTTDLRAVTSVDSCVHVGQWEGHPLRGHLGRVKRSHWVVAHWWECPERAVVTSCIIARLVNLSFCVFPI